MARKSVNGIYLDCDAEKVDETLLTRKKTEENYAEGGRGKSFVSCFLHILLLFDYKQTLSAWLQFIKKLRRSF